ncbi:acetyltransferase [Paenibacillus sp. YYML68]|uniref:acetyltransferase n=1 Tax=Paenibacillus sp. YYML68 TaxID=2909250 RepID=UPI0024921A8B|nr:acetyltransferase [Paenibacillus sp. YYML68]
MRRLIILGAGGHGKVVADAAEQSGQWSEIAFLDDNYPDVTHVYGWSIIDRISNLEQYVTEYVDVVVAIGSNGVRLSLLQEAVSLGYRAARVIHPRAFVSKYAEIGVGTVCLAQSAVNAGATIGNGVIINTGSTVDHDCSIAAGVHISPGAHLAGNVTVGKCSWVGLGASIIQQTNIGSYVTIGAGSVVIRNIPDNTKVVGVPAKALT